LKRRYKPFRGSNVEDEQVRTRRRITKQAIDLAMQGKWREAVAANKSLIENHAAGDVETYNRLGRSYLEVGEYEPARQAYARALDLDRYNVIARKNLERLQRLQGAGIAVAESPNRFEPGSFLEETGKAGVVTLHHPGAEPVVAGLVAGDKVQLKAEGKKLVIQNNRGDYIGLVEPKHAFRLLRLMAGGNRYSANIISNGGTLTVMIREVYQDPSQVGHVSFPPRGFERLRPYVNERLAHRSAETGEEGEEEENYGEIDREDGLDGLFEESADFDDKVNGDY
jgi:tetratricopeptide (TPR) repeat protein